MKYLPEYQLFILKKITLSNKESEKYGITELAYKNENWNKIFEYILEIVEEGYINIASFIIESRYIENRKRDGYQFGSETDYYGLGKEIADKVIEQDPLKLDDIKHLLSKQETNDFIKRYLFPYLTIEINLDKNRRSKIKNKLEEYAKDFINDKLTKEIYEPSYFNFKKSFNILKNFLDGYIYTYTSENIRLGTIAIGNSYSQGFNTDDQINMFSGSFRFLETLMAFELRKLIKIKEMFSNGECIVDYTEREDDNIDIQRIGRFFSRDKVFQWHCSVCGNKIKEAKDVNEILEWLKKYSPENACSCKKYPKHKNWLIVKDEKIYFIGSASLDDSKVFRKIK